MSDKGWDITLNIGHVFWGWPEFLNDGENDYRFIRFAWLWFSFEISWFGSEAQIREGLEGK